MSLIKINGVTYEVKINKYRLQPLFMINGSVMDVGLWDDTSVEETNLLLLEAISLYELHNINNTLKKCDFHIHEKLQTG